MKITFDNFEAYLLDYIEGNLDATKTSLLISFLADHPELDVEMELFPVPADSCFTNHFESPEELKKQDNAIAATSYFNAENYENSFVAFHEGDFSAEQETALHHFLNQNPHLISEFESYGKLRTEPDFNIVCPDKQALKQHRIIPMYLRWLAPGVAAALALFILFNQKTVNDNFSPIQPSIVAINDQPVASVDRQQTQIPETHSLPSKADILNDMHHVSMTKSTPVKRSAEVITQLQPLPATNIEIDGSQQFVLMEGSRYYTNLYTDIRLRDQIRFQEEIEAQANQTIYGDAKAVADKNKFDLWSIAKLGVKGFNFLTNSDIDFVKARNEKGEVTDYAIGGDAIRIAHSSN